MSPPNPNPDHPFGDHPFGDAPFGPRPDDADQGGGETVVGKGLLESLKLDRLSLVRN